MSLFGNDKDVRVAGTEQLMVLCETAERFDLNCQIDLDAGDQTVADGVAKLDSDGTHVLIPLLYDHRADPRRNLPPHHRVEVLVKLEGTYEPLRLVLDVCDEQWQQLTKLEDLTPEEGSDG